MSTQDKLPQALRELADKFSVGWHDGIKIDATDIVTLTDAAEILATHEAGNAPQQAQGAPTCLDIADLQDRLVAVSQAVADQDDRAAQAMLSETLKLLAAPQAAPAPAPQALTEREPLTQELMKLCESIVRLHKERGIVLTIHIENMDDLLQEMAAGITKEGAQP